MTTRLGFIYAFSGNLGAAFFQFIVLSVLAHISDHEHVGIYALGLAIANPIFILSGMGMRNIVAADVEGKNSDITYFNMRVTSTIMAVMAYLIIGYACCTARGLPVIFMLGIYKATESIFEIVFGIYQRRKLMKTLGLTQIAKSAFSTLAFSIMLILSKSLSLAIFAQVLVGAAAFTIAEFMTAEGRIASLLLKSRVEGHAIGGEGQRLFFDAIPLSLGAFFASIFINGPRYALGNNPSSVGLYAILTYPLVVGNTLVASIAQASITTLAEKFSLKSNFKAAVLGQAAFCALVGVVICIAVLAKGEFILSLLFGGSYASYGREFLILSVAAVFQYITWSLGNTLVVMKRYRSILLLRFASMMAMIAILAVFSFKMDVRQACYAMLLSSFIQGVLFLISVFKIRAPQKA